MPKPFLRQSDNSQTLVIAINTAVSGKFNVRASGGRGFAIQIPAVWTAANIGFDISADASTWIPLYGDTGARVKITGVPTGLAVELVAPAEVWAIGASIWMRLVSVDTTDDTATTNQAAERTLIVRALV